MRRVRNGRSHCIARRRHGLSLAYERPPFDTQIIDNGQPSCRLTSDAKRISQVPIAKDESSQDDAPFFDGNRDMSVIKIGIRVQGVRYTLPGCFGIRRRYGSGCEVNRSLLLPLEPDSGPAPRPRKGA